MTDPIAVTKMHGALNDFVVLDARAQPLDSLAEFAIRACNRRSGVGADGLIAIEAPERGGVRMRVFNPDGREAEMCGNGVRCAARWLDEAGEGDETAFETGAGTVRTRVVSRTPEYLVRAEMPAPKVATERLARFDGAFVVDAGNPHVVILRERVDDVEIAMIAERLQTNPRFPNGINVHVAAGEGGGLRVRHWERGAGLTMACGTGAVACAAVAIVCGLAVSPVTVRVPGGTLVVEWDGEGPAYLTGPAVRVFETALRTDAG